VDEDDDTGMQVDNPAPGGETATFVLDPDLKSGRTVKPLRNRSRAATKKRSPPSNTHAKMVESSNLSVHREFVKNMKDKTLDERSTTVDKSFSNMEP